MKRRKFLESVSKFAISSSALPFIASNTLSGFMYGCSTDTVPSLTDSGPTWFNTEPLRMAWFRLTGLDAASDPNAVVDRCIKDNFNCILNTAVKAGAFYPSEIPFNEPCSSLPKGKDFYGGVSALAKQNNMKTGVRFDFTKQSKAALEAHPEWFIRLIDGRPVTDAEGLAHPCLNSDFYPTQGISIISEVMDRYKPDFVYLNWFANFLGNGKVCFCKSCENSYRKKFGRSLPAEPDVDYMSFIKETSDRISTIISNTIHEKWPGTLFLNADNIHSDGCHIETHQGAWTYFSSEAVNRKRTSYPDRVGINMWFGYSGDASQPELMPLEEMKMRFYQFGAHGSPLTYCTDGSILNPAHGVELEVLRNVNAWHDANADLYGLQSNLSRVLMCCEPETSPRWRNPIPEQTNRGIYSMLTEAHIPVAVSENPTSLLNTSQTYDLVIVTEGASTEGVREYVERGGRALFINQTPSFGIPPMVRKVSDDRTGYVEIRDPDAFPSIAGIRYVECSGSYITGSRIQNAEGAMLVGIGSNLPAVESSAKSQAISDFYVYPDEERTSLTFVNPVAEIPADLSDQHLKSTEIPALITRDFGKGHIAFVPWDIGGFYTRKSLPEHAGLFIDIVDSLLQNGRQIRSNAPASVELVFMFQPDNKRSILHLINGSGKTPYGYQKPKIFQSIDIDLAGNFSAAGARVSGMDLKISNRNGRSSLTLPVLKEYEAIVLM